MLQYEELRGQLLSHKNALDELAEALGLEKMKAEIADLEAQAAQDGFWTICKNPRPCSSAQAR